jgi:Papain family cysteine protease
VLWRGHHKCYLDSVAGFRRRILVAMLASLPCACRGSGAGDDAGPATMGSVDKSPAKAPPPLRAPHPGVPSLPDLPALAAHEPPAPSPQIKLVDHPCGGVWNGFDVVPLVCSKSALLFGVGEGGAIALVPDKLLHPADHTLPSVVDHRHDGSEGPVRDQRTSPACTAFSMAAAIDHALARWTSKLPPVSVMQIWSRYRSPAESTSIGSNLGLSLGAESDWPFDAAAANGWMPCPPAGAGAKNPPGGCGKPVDEAHRRKVESRPVASITRVEFVGVSDLAALEQKLAAGQDVIVTLAVPDSFAPKGSAGARYVPHWTKPSAADSGHAVVLAGYAALPHGTYFLIHNSWGAGWGDGGFAWLHEASLKAWGREALVLDADPAGSDAVRSARARGETSCPGDMVPDSIRGACTARCPDGGPRHDGACPVAGQCPAGYVNLTGACVVAAPSSASKDPSSGISWRCGPSGCAYAVPRSVAKTCTGATCLVSCPAPDFHLARAQGRLTCIE